MNTVSSCSGAGPGPVPVAVAVQPAATGPELWIAEFVPESEAPPPSMTPESQVLATGSETPPSAGLTVAEALSDKNLDALKVALKSVTGKDVALNVKIDPSIIGGLVVKLGSRMIDSSLRTKLNSIKHAMKEAG